jgi:hypothetical protein
VDLTSNQNERLLLFVQQRTSNGTTGGDGSKPFNLAGSELDAVVDARRTWEQNICQELNAIAREQKVPIARVVQDGEERPELKKDEKGNVYSSSSSSSEPLRFLFDCDDLLDAVQRVGSSNLIRQRERRSNTIGGATEPAALSHSKPKSTFRPEESGRNTGTLPSVVPTGPDCHQWGLVSLQLKTCSMSQLRFLFSELHPRYRQIGIDDALSGDALQFGDSCTDESFLETRTKMALRLAASGSMVETRNFAKRGIPAGVRPQLYQRVYGVTVGAREHHYFSTLTQHCRDVEYLTDTLYRLDARQIGDNDNFFPFEEVLEKVMMVFARDTWLADHCKCNVLAPMLGKTQDGTEVGRVPPSGVPPFCGLVWYASPLCFLYPDPEPIFFVFRKMFAEHWCHLNRISANDSNDSLLNLCKLFEDLLQTSNPEVVVHVGLLGLNPLEISFSWIHGAFADYLDVDQVLLLWDRLIGYNSLVLLPVLAAAIVSFRANEALLCKTAEEVFALYEDPRKIKALPLLQHFLFQSHRFDDDLHFVNEDI